MKFENEKRKGVSVREREIVRLEPQCEKCNKTEYMVRKHALQGITIGALLYGIVVTLLTAVHNEVLVSDCKSFLDYWYRFLSTILEKMNQLILEGVNELGNYNLYYVLWMMAVCIIMGMGDKVICFCRTKARFFWNPYAYSVLLFDLVLIVFGGEYIKGVFGVNLIGVAIGIYVLYMMLSVVKKYYEER